MQSQRKLLRNAIGRVAFSAGRFDVSLRLLSLLCAVFVGLNVQSVWAADYWPPEGVRIATFNCSLNRDQAGRLITDLEGGRNEQARKIARILRTVRPAVVLLNEFDFDADGRALKSFHDEYLSKTADWATETPISYRYRFTAPVNTGVPTGRDLDHDKKTDGPGDAFGFGRFPGQYGMVVLSQYPIDEKAVRSFQNFLWKDMPNAALPPADGTGAGSWYSDEDLAIFRLSSKSHWNVPIQIHGRTLFFLVSHPTPPAFDGPEDRNGRRNHDEIRLWAEYISDEPRSWLKDDRGTSAVLDSNEMFVVAGDLNADPSDGASYNQAIHQLLKHPRIDASVTPSSEGGVVAAETQKEMNLQHKGNPAHDTADFGDRNVGNLRADYVLPSVTCKTIASGVFWPKPGEPDRI